MSGTMNAIELLKLADHGRQKPFLNQYWAQILGVSFGVATGVFINFGARRPVFSGIQKHILGIAGWTTVFTLLQNRRDAYFAERDAVYRDYIRLHPEDFPIPEKVKIGEIFEPWIPIR